MIRIQAAWLSLLLLVPAVAWAQDDNAGGLGLDLTDDNAKKDEQKKDEEVIPTPEKKPVTETPPATPNAEQGAAQKKDNTLGEREVIQDDRVKSVQRKVYLKKHRFEIAPFIGLSVNDPYYSKWGANVRVGYFLADTLSLGVRAHWMNVARTDDVVIAKRDFQSRIFFSVPQWGGIADVEWSPVYGKVAWFNSILHFDGYLLGGAGVMNTESSLKIGLAPAVEVGVGMRFVAKDFLAVNACLLNTSYVDQPVGTTKGATQNILTLNAGVSIFLPLKSTGREAE
ncbi:MAG: outer membrane beta-barrel domain-containing protein [Myxococcaceae bacterium]